VSLFDVSLRDGIQNTKNHEKYSTEAKKAILKTIIQTRAPESIELGSFVNSRVLPIMKDTEEVLKYGLEYAKLVGIPQNYYVLIPNIKQMTRALKSPVVINHVGRYKSSVNFSFIASTSESFQLKNAKMTLDTSRSELNVMTRWLSYFWPSAMTKLYVSCVNECPFEGKIANSIVAKEISAYNQFGEFDEICLSDTMGTLEPADLDEILSKLKHAPYLPIGKLSLHLHGFEGEPRVSDLLHVAQKRGIRQFDVSSINEGGCSVTMDDSNIKPNLTYRAFDDIR
jgi:hydroxymethylglutaryl-CoA lyase